MRFIFKSICMFYQSQLVMFLIFETFERRKGHLSPTQLILIIKLIYQINILVLSDDLVLKAYKIISLQGFFNWVLGLQRVLGGLLKSSARK